VPSDAELDRSVRPMCGCRATGGGAAYFDADRLFVYKRGTRVMISATGKLISPPSWPARTGDGGKIWEAL